MSLDSSTNNADMAPSHSSAEPRSRQSIYREAVLIGLLALTLNLIGNGRMSLWDRDEPRYAEATREMRQSGDWIHPTFNAEPRYHKPILIYWLMLAGTAIGGDNPFGARLVSALMGTGTVLLIWWWGRRVLGDKIGRLSALVLTTMPLMVAESKLATTDATLTLFVVGCQVALWELWVRPSRGAAAAFWALLGLAVLTKSPAGPALLIASIGISWLSGGPSPFTYLARLRWKWGPLLFLAIILPWNIAIFLRSNGEYFNVAIGFHVVKRATQGLEEHGGFPGYYIVLGMASLFPWSALLPRTLASAWAQRRETPLVGFLIGWVIGPLILLECVRTKLIHYYLPAVPAVAVLVAWRLVRSTDVRFGLPRWKLGRSGAVAISVASVLVTVGLLVCGFRMLPSPMLLPTIGVACIIAAGTVFGLREMLAGRIERATLGGIAFTAVALATFAGWFLPALEPYRTPAMVGQRLAALERSLAVRPILSTFKPPGVIFALGHPAPVVKSWEHLGEELDKSEVLLIPMIDKELNFFRKRPNFKVEVQETVDGFNIEKGSIETLYLTLIRANDPQVATKPGSSPSAH
ncbi:ArnT family glycosyltransferase [Singulisphaera sp. PoT]|uniref:ArnT family glycosyltransferase n=1 Tax=Singulisphaera sp. PoT TaxID=3411797 RepID=UPI003BF57EE6